MSEPRTATITREYAVWLSDCIEVDVPDEIEDADIDAWAIDNYPEHLTDALNEAHGTRVRYQNEWIADINSLDAEIIVEWSHE